MALHLYRRILVKKNLTVNTATSTPSKEKAYIEGTLFWVSADKRRIRVQELDNSHLKNIIAMLEDGRWQTRTKSTKKENREWLNLLRKERQKRKI